MKDYTHISIDVLNIAYRVFFSLPNSSKTLIRISNKSVYTELVRDFINLVSFWKTKFLKEGGEVYLLFDNPTSRDELKKLFQPMEATSSRKEKFPEYKANRTPASKEFYNSVDLIKWYFMMGPKDNFSVRVNHIEADDLVKPFLEHISDASYKALLITNDSDWCRFIGDSVDYLPNLYEEAKTYLDYKLSKGYYPTEDKIVLDKIIFGDAADNVSSAFPDLDKSQKEFLLLRFESIQDMYSSLGEDDIPSELKIYCRAQERQARIVFQMVSIIPIQREHFEACLVQGREASSYISIIHKALGIDDSPQASSFQFNFLQYPRVEPKEK